MDEHWFPIAILAALLRATYVSWNIFFYLVHTILLHAFYTECVTTSFNFKDFSNTQIFHANPTVERLGFKLSRSLFEIGRIKRRYWICLYSIFVLIARICIIFTFVYLFDNIPFMVFSVVIAFVCTGRGILANFWRLGILILILDLVFIFVNQWLKRFILKLFSLQVTNEIPLLIKF